MTEETQVLPLSQNAVDTIVEALCLLAVENTLSDFGDLSRVAAELVKAARTVEQAGR